MESCAENAKAAMGAQWERFRGSLCDVCHRYEREGMADRFCIITACGIMFWGLL